MRAVFGLVTTWYLFPSPMSQETEPPTHRLPGRAQFQLAALILLSSLVSGCVGSLSALKPQDVASVNRTFVRSYLHQNGLNGEYMLSGYGAGSGLIGAIVDTSVNSARASTAAKRVQPIREMVSDFDLRATYWLALSNAICPVPWLKVERFETHPSGIQAVPRALAAQGAVLNIGSSYYLSQDCRVLVFKTGFDFYLPGRRGRPAAMSLVTYNSKEIGRAGRGPGDSPVDC